MPGRLTLRTVALAQRRAARFDRALSFAGPGVDRRALASPDMTRTLIALALLLAVLPGCGGSSSSQSANPNAQESSPPGDIPDNQAFVAYSPPGADYGVKVPEGWARSAAGGAVTFTDKLNSIRMEETTSKGAATPAAAKRTELPQLARRVKGYKPGSVTLVKRTSGPAVRITYLASGRPDPVTGKARTNAVERYLFVHNGKQVVLTLSGPKGADNVDPWKLVTDSVEWSR
jgi:hypothetical protein